VHLFSFIRTQQVFRSAPVVEVSAPLIYFVYSNAAHDFSVL